MIGAIILSVIPIAVLIGLGYTFRALRFLPVDFWLMAERLCYFCLLPSLFVHGLSSADFSGVPILDLAVAIIIPTVAVTLSLLIWQEWSKIEGAAFTSIFQGGIRFNNYIGVTAAIALFGPATIGLAAVANATIVPMVNVLVVLAFSRYGTARLAPWDVIRGVVTNPLIVGCAVGTALACLDLSLPRGVDAAVAALGQASLPIGLLCVGAALDLRVLGSKLRHVCISSSVKFLLVPTATIATCLWLGMDGRVAMIAVLFQSLPTASSSYVMARLLGGDAPLMAGIVAFQTLIALLTLPLTLYLAAILFMPNPA